MATIQACFDVAEVLNRELALQTSEADVTNGLRAYNMAKRHFETQVAKKKHVLEDAIGTVTTAASTESTAFPTGVLRIDRLQFIDAGTSRPAWDLIPIHRTGGHIHGQWPPILSSSSSTGKPRYYYTNGSNIYWSPLPDGTNTVRYYGFAVAAAATAATDTFPYPDIVIDPIGAFIAEVFNIGVDDANAELQLMSARLFSPVIEALSNFQRDGARMPTYASVHRV